MRAKLAKLGQINFSGHGSHSGKANCLICAMLGDSPCLKVDLLTTSAHIGYSKSLKELQLQQEKSKHSLVVNFKRECTENLDAVDTFPERAPGGTMGLCCLFTARHIQQNGYSYFNPTSRACIILYL